MSTKQNTEPQITKRRVTMRGVVMLPSGEVREVEAVDYVDAAREGFLEAYVADAQTRWPYVGVSDEPDAGPDGYHGATIIPAHLDHPLAGQEFPATPESER